jgi:hypothetical protein
MTRQRSFRPGDADPVENFTPTFSQGSFGAISLRYAIKLVVARALLREIIVFGGAMALCQRALDGLLPLSA